MFLLKFVAVNYWPEVAQQFFSLGETKILYLLVLIDFNQIYQFMISKIYEIKIWFVEFFRWFSIQHFRFLIIKMLNYIFFVFYYM